ncbi:MAG: hypothetical protein AABW47_03835 [Nanoarchaeota archaeon]
MKLETLLKPVKYLDENVILRQYTKLGQKINIDEGKRKYKVGLALDILSIPLIMISNKEIFGGNISKVAFFSGVADWNYNGLGILGAFGENKTSETIAINPFQEILSKWNKYWRLPLFLTGVGLIGKVGLDFANSLMNNTEVHATDYYALCNGIGCLSLASSMYLKETDTKLLDKSPLWKKALNYVKEQISLIGPQPIPVPIRNYEIAENQ